MASQGQDIAQQLDGFIGKADLHSRFVAAGLLGRASGIDAD